MIHMSKNVKVFLNLIKYYLSLEYFHFQDIHETELE